MPETPQTFLTRDMLRFSENTSFILGLQVISVSTNPIYIWGFTKEGHFTYTHIPAGDSSLEYVEFAVPDIPVMLSVSMDIGNEDGVHAFVSLSLNISGNIWTTLAQGTISGTSAVSWPHHLNDTTEQLDGHIVDITTTNPAADAEIEHTVPDHQVWEILGFDATLTADAQAANRTVALQFNIGGSAPIRRADGTAITANQAVEIRGVPTGTTAVILANEIHEIGLPERIILPPGSLISTSTANRQSGDNWSAAVITVRRKFVNFST